MQSKFILAIDLGGTNLKIGLLNSSFKILRKHVLSTKSHVSKGALIKAIIDSVNTIAASSGVRKSEIIGLGVGLPGPIDVQKGLVHFFPNIPGWKEVRLKAILENKLRVPVFLDNDANLMCLAEFKLGAAKNTTNAVCLTLGTGVGAGIIIDGTLYRAKTFAAGEIGHIPINESGPRCNCGGIACVETYVGNKRIVALARKMFGRDIPLETLSNMARKGNKKALALWRTIGAHLGTALVGVVNLLNPDCIVIGGGVAKAGKVLFDSVKNVVASHAMKIQARHVKIVKSKLGSDAGLIGAAILAKEGFSV